MTFANLVRRWGVHHVSTVRGPLPNRVNAATQRRSVPTPTCGAIDHLSGAVCTLAPHTHPFHEDHTDPLTSLKWREDEWTAHRGRPWQPPTLRLIGADQ